MVTPVVERGFDRELQHVVGGAACLGIHPNSVSTAGLFLNLVAALLLAMGQHVLGGVAIMCSGILDMVDGRLARMTGQASIFGGI